MAGVVISVSKDGSEILTYETDASGKYTFPPLDDSIVYQVAAQRERYVLVGPDLNGNFKAHKLAEVTVEVVDYNDQSPLQVSKIVLLLALKFLWKMKNTAALLHFLKLQASINQEHESE